MKRNRIQGISAAVASLALAGTCFAAPAYAASNSVFGSGFSGQPSTETPITSSIAEPVPDTSQATMPDDPDDVDPDFLVDSDVDYAALVMEMLGLDDAALDHPQELPLRSRLDRALYLSDDRQIAAKFVRGRRLF